MKKLIFSLALLLGLTMQLFAEDKWVVYEGEEGFGMVPELTSNNLRMWQRSITTDPKTGDVTTTDWTLYSPANTTAAGLLPLMTNDMS